MKSRLKTVSLKSNKSIDTPILCISHYISNEQNYNFSLYFRATQHMYQTMKHNEGVDQGPHSVTNLVKLVYNG